ncbi:MAG: hypothetical protein ABIN39_05500 [candidate division WOR-3 bacterium]
MLNNSFIISILIIFALLVNFIILYNKKGSVISFIILLNIYSLIIFFLDNDIISILFVLFNSFITSILMIKFINEIEAKK